MGGFFHLQQIHTAGVGSVIVLAGDHLWLANQPKEEIDAGGRPRCIYRHQPCTAHLSRSRVALARPAGEPR